MWHQEIFAKKHLIVFVPRWRHQYFWQLYQNQKVQVMASFSTQLFLKGSLSSAWQSSSDRRRLPKSMKLILWSPISLKNCYLFLCEGKQTYNNRKLIVSKIVFLHKEGSRGCRRGSRFVWVIMCVRPTLGYCAVLC